MEQKEKKKFDLKCQLKKIIRAVWKAAGWIKQKKKESGMVDGLPVFRVGPKKKGIIALWVLMGTSLCFGVYKNFTAVNKETVYERTVVEQQITDTNEIESFAEHFAYLYHAWGKSQEEKNSRQAALAGYMTDELVKIISGTITGECPTISEVLNVRVCGVEKVTDNVYKIRYSVKQQFTEADDREASVEKKELPAVMAAGGDAAVPAEGFEGTQTGETADDTKAATEMPDETEEQAAGTSHVTYGQAVTTNESKVLQQDGTYVAVTERESYYQIEVYVDETGGMVVITNPTTCGVAGKSAYVPEERQSNGSIDTASMSEMEDFLNTFFALYPTATAKELAYYAKDGIMDVIGADYVYDGLYSAAYYKEDDQIKAHVYVKYLDQTAKMTQLSEYTLTMEKGDNWRIVSAQ